MAERLIEVLSDASSGAGGRSCGWCPASLVDDYLDAADEVQRWIAEEDGQQRLSLVKRAPLRKITELLRPVSDVYGRQTVRLECGHEVRASDKAIYRARCPECAFDHSRRTKLPRGNCSVCGREVAVRRNGTAREHQSVLAGARNRNCPGSGEPVRTQAKVRLSL